MTIIPASRLSRSDMLILGNNVRPTVRSARTPLVEAVNIPAGSFSYSEGEQGL